MRTPYSIVGAVAAFVALAVGTPAGASAPHAVLAGTVAASAGTNGSCRSEQSTIAIGSVGEQSGLIGASVGSGPKAVQAWVDSVNAHGGIQCHPVKYVVADDGSDPARNLELVQQEVQQDHVVAFVYMNSVLAMQGSESWLTANKIPVIGSPGTSDYMYQSPTFYPQKSSGNETNYTEFAAIKPQMTAAQRRHLGLLTCVESLTCRAIAVQGPNIAQGLGMNVVYNGSGSLFAPDFTAQCLAAKQAGVQTLLVSLDANGVTRLLASCDHVSFHPQYALFGTAYAATLLSQPDLEGAVFGVGVIPWVVTTNAKVAAFRSAMTRYAPGVSLAGSALDGWASAQLFAAAMASQHLPANPTSQTVLNGMGTIKNDTLGGLTGPLTFSKGKDAPRLDCWFTMAIKSGKLISPNHGKVGCRGSVKSASA
jgi:branched-chain amino acid transport system substrate-binding protein